MIVVDPQDIINEAQEVGVVLIAFAREDQADQLVQTISEMSPGAFQYTGYEGEPFLLAITRIAPKN